jgi:hypothetical protein|nr:MAG TPA: hypothetical protein [Caudoviricetes sp.]
MSQKKQLKINQDKFDEEIERIERYLNMISNRKMSTYECISILEDLGVIEDKGSLDNFEVIEELSNHFYK